MREARQRSTLGRVLASLLFVAFVAFLSAAPVSAAPARAAQDVVCDPTGEICHPQPPPSVEAHCSVSDDTPAPGQTITGHVEDVPDGTKVSVTFDGQEVASGTAESKNGETTASADIDFTVPHDAGDGGHTIAFSGAGFSCSVHVGVAVLGESITRDNGSSLVRTGINVAALVAIGLVLVITGLQLRRAAQRRAKATKYEHRQHLHR
jgi:hypothetical protein